MASDSQQDEQQLLLPIIDSHIHLFPEADAEKQIWWQPGTGFDGPHSVNQFKEAAKSSPSLLGFVLIESHMKNAPQPGSSEEYDWTYPLEEAARMTRLALGKPQEGDEASPEDARLCLGLVPWAPMTSGPEVLERYISQLQEVVGDAWSKVKGFRFLVQDKPHGTMLEDKFIQSLRLLGRKGLVFDVGVDHHRRGKKQLEELLSMIDLAHDGVPEEERVTFIINHLGKPDLSIYNITSDPAFNTWRTTIYTLAKCSKTYMKLSGGFSEMNDSLKTSSSSHIFQSTFPWLGIVLATFGPSRTMFGSDWPVCTAGVDDAWTHWKEVVEKMCWMATMGDEDRAMLFGGTAKKAYNL